VLQFDARCVSVCPPSSHSCCFTTHIWAVTPRGWITAAMTSLNSGPGAIRIRLCMRDPFATVRPVRFPQASRRVWRPAGERTWPFRPVRIVYVHAAKATSIR
jgi:hypothetical protein